MKLITEDNIRKFIPNYIEPVGSESSVFQKIEVYIVGVESYLCYKWFSRIENVSEKSLDIARNFVFYTAFYNALPSLDVVLTPNGFGIVSTSNVAPASKDRVDRMRENMLHHSNNYFSILVESLHDDDVWKKSADFWPHPIQRPVLIAEANKQEIPLYEFYDTFEFFTAKFLQWICGKVLSPLLWNMILKNPKSEDFWYLYTMVVSLAIKNYRSLSVPDFRQCSEMVQYIRERPALFDIWKNTDVAAYWSLKSFENKQSNHGYFF